MIIKLVEIVLVAACCAVGARHYLHMLQLESYQLPGYRRYLGRNLDKMFRSLVLVGIVFTVLDFIMKLLIQPFTTGQTHSKNRMGNLCITRIASVCRPVYSSSGQACTGCSSRQSPSTAQMEER